MKDREIEVFGERKKLFMWLKIPNKALGNKTPDSYTQLKAEMQRVLDILPRIEHGV